VELKHLRSFVVLAEELHFSRAALRLHLAQSAVSAQIKRLEEEVGGPLLNRTTRQVELTEAGRVLLSEARTLLSAADGTLGRVRAAARGEDATLSIASLGPVPESLFSPLLATFSTRRPHVRIELRQLAFPQMLSALREGTADVEFIYEPLHESDLDVVPLERGPRMVALSRSHPLAERDFLTPADLRCETFIPQSDATPKYWQEYWMLVDELGMQPRISSYVGDNIEEWLHLIGRGEGIDTCPAVIARYFARPDVTYLPLQGAANATLVVAVIHDARTPLINEFIELATAIARSRNPEGSSRAPVEG
jgi:DNA-binding transcriptional LysR family regulator